jgi:hypothetical protein
MAQTDVDGSAYPDALEMRAHLVVGQRALVTLIYYVSLLRAQVLYSLEVASLPR